MAGSPTFITEPSMNARLEARMVVVRMRRGWAAVDLAGCRAACARARSQCGGKPALTARAPRPDRLRGRYGSAALALALASWRMRGGKLLGRNPGSMPSALIVSAETNL